MCERLVGCLADACAAYRRHSWQSCAMVIIPLFCISVFLFFFMYFPTFPLKTLYGNDSLTYNFFHLNPAVENITSVSNLRPSIFRFCCWLPLVLLALHDGTVVMIIIVVAMITDVKMMIIIIVMMITDCLSRWYEEKQL